MASALSAAHDWSRDVYQALKAFEVRLAATVPDAGLARLIDLIDADPAMRLVTLTTEEEGAGLATGAWLGGERTALLMQSSGVGNCINALSMPALCGVPLIMIVTMRGEWGEFNPWQVPMGQAVRPTLAALGVRLFEVVKPEEAGETTAAAARLAFSGGAQVAVLITQRMLGAKRFGDK